MSHQSLQNLDKSNWQKLPFGEIAKSIGERVDPTTTDLETYVGLEHIDAQSIHIKRFGKREDVSGTKLRCYPGDVIFGRRRAYQRKAAICEFDGFCSAHSLVLRANPKAIDPKLFPFFLHSDQFMHRAVDISVGGLSPTINWTKLKQENFLVPPKDQQAKLAELLWRADEAVSQSEFLLASTKTAAKVKFGEFLVDYRTKERVRLGDICRAKQWKTISQDQFTDSGYPVYGANGQIGFYSEFNHAKRAIAITCRGATCGNVHFTPENVYITGNAMCLEDIDESKFNPEFLFLVLSHLNLAGIITGSAQPQIIKDDVERFRINDLPIVQQLEQVKLMSAFSNAIAANETR
jgi:type I restriction enzyme S subunit